MTVSFFVEQITVGCRRERIYPFRLSTPHKPPYGDGVNLVGQGLAPAGR